MTPKLSSVIRFLRQLVAGSLAPRRSIAMSVAIRVLFVGASVLCASGAQNRGDMPCHVALGESSDLDLLEEGITIIPQSHVSVTKTADMLWLHVLKGEVLLKQRETAAEPVVVTAGNAQLRNIPAVICVNVHKERTDVSVLDGAAELWTQEGQQQGDQQEWGGMTLQAGDRVEIRRFGQEPQFRLSHFGADSAHCAM